MRLTRLPTFALAVLACREATASEPGASPAGIDWQSIGGFQIPRTETTVAQFARFARATQTVTRAERLGGGSVTVTQRPAARRQGANGLHEMGGNAWEWVDEPPGVADNADRRTRGGSWWYGQAQMRASHLRGKPGDTTVVYVGSRCARDG